MFSSPLRLSAVVLVFALAVHADEKDEVKAKSALALAKAKREREQSKAAAQMACHLDLDSAQKEAEKSGKRLVLWVGVTCKDHPQLRTLLDAAVHCHLDSWRGDDEPRIVIRGGDGMEYVAYPQKMTSETKTAENIKKAWARTYVPPPDPPKRAGISEELSKRKATGPCQLCGAVCDCGAGCVCDRETAKRKTGGAAARTTGEAVVPAPLVYYTPATPVYSYPVYSVPSFGFRAGVALGRIGASIGACVGGA